MFSFRLAIGCRNMSGQAKISSFFTQSTNKRVISNGDTVVISLFISKTNAKSIPVYNAYITLWVSLPNKLDQCV